MYYYIKKCENCRCASIWHNVPKKINICGWCSCTINIITKKTWKDKYLWYPLQFDYNTDERFYKNLEWLNK